MYISNFNYHKPKTLIEAYEILGSKEHALAMAGGTDLLVEIKQGIRSMEDLVSLNDIDVLKTIEDDNKNVYIGANNTHNQIQKSEIINKYIPALSNAVSTIGTRQIRNIGTIGGNLCTCASCADSAPILLIYNADVEIGSKNGNKIVKLSDFLLGHHKTALQKGELMIKIIVKKPKSNFGAYYLKYGLREASAISVASVAVGVLIENNIIVDANIVVGACAPTPIKVPNATKKILNQNINELKKGSFALEDIGKTAASEIFPINDIRGSGDYRRDIVNVLTQRTVIKAIKSIQN